MELFIGTPCYSGTPHPAHNMSVKATMELYGNSVGYHRQPGDSSLPRARATLLGAFLEYERNWTHFLQTDDDQSWDPHVIRRLVELDYPVICLPCAYKFDSPHPYSGYSTIRGLPGAVVFPDGVLDVKYMGGGWILWRKDTLEKICTPEWEFWTNAASLPRVRTYMLWCGGLSEPDGEGKKEYLTEDYWISHLTKQAGVQPRAFMRACSPHWKGETPYLPKGFEMEVKSNALGPETR